MAEAKTITILDIEFPCTMPYDPGHVLNEAEAKVLNQTRRENLGNNYRKTVQLFKDQGEGAAATEAELIAAFVELDTEYVFTLANVTASRKFSPEEKEARNIARAYIRQELDKEGRKIGEPGEGYTQDEWDAAIEAQIDEISVNPEVVKIAKETVKARSKTAGLQLGGLGLNTKAQAAE